MDIVNRSPTCHGPMRVVAFITQAMVIDQILAHLRTRAGRWQLHAVVSQQSWS